MNDTPRFRSPPSPYIGLARAVERTELLYSKARHFSVPVTTAADAWGMKATSSSTLQTIAALLQYGLLEDDGSKGARRVNVSPLGMSIVTDKRPDSPDRDKFIKQAALNPPVFREMWEEFGEAALPDSAIVHSLTYARRAANKAPFSDDAAKDVIRVYRETVSFSRLAEIDGQASPEAPDDKPPAVVGDIVQWAPGGSLALPEPARVRFVSPDNAWAFVEGSETGIPMQEIEIVAPAASGYSAPPPPPPVPSATLPPRLPVGDGALAAPAHSAVGSDNIKLTIDGGRVLITASVDLAGLRRLQKKLTGIAALLEDEDDPE